MRENKTGLNILTGYPEFQTNVREPFAKCVIAYLDALSKEIRSSVAAQPYVDLLSFGFWIRKSHILQLKQTVQLQHSVGRGLVFHVAPSNVPVNFAYTLVFGLLAGNSNVVKVSSKDFAQVRLICQLMNRVAEKEEYSWFLQENQIVQYDSHQTEWTEYYSGECDVRVIWGGDETIRQIRRCAMQPRATELTFADRYSVALMDTDEVLAMNDKELERLTQQFYNDTFLMDQNACSSPQLIFWRGERMETASERFWNSLYQCAKKKYELADVKVSEKYTMLCELGDIGQTQLVRYENYIYVLRLQRLPEDITILRGRFGLFFEYSLHNMEELISHMDRKVQTCAVCGVNRMELAEMLAHAGVPGVDRIVSIGSTLDMGLTWDGYDVISSLSRKISY